MKRPPQKSDDSFEETRSLLHLYEAPEPSASFQSKVMSCWEREIEISSPEQPLQKTFIALWGFRWPSLAGAGLFLMCLFLGLSFVVKPLLTGSSNTIQVQLPEKRKAKQKAQQKSFHQQILREVFTQNRICNMQAQRASCLQEAGQMGLVVLFSRKMAPLYEGQKHYRNKVASTFGQSLSLLEPALSEKQFAASIFEQSLPSKASTFSEKQFAYHTR